MKTSAVLASALAALTLSAPDATAHAPDAKKVPTLKLVTQTPSFDVRDKEIRKDVTVNVTIAIPEGWKEEINASNHSARYEGPVPPGGKPYDYSYMQVQLACDGVCAGSLMRQQMKESAQKRREYAKKSKRTVLEDKQVSPDLHVLATRHPTAPVINFDVRLYRDGWPRMLQCSGGLRGETLPAWEQLVKACSALTATVVER